MRFFISLIVLQLSFSGFSHIYLHCICMIFGPPIMNITLIRSKKNAKILGRLALQNMNRDKFFIKSITCKSCNHRHSDFPSKHIGKHSHTMILLS